MFININFDICCLFSLLVGIFGLNMLSSVLLRFQQLGVEKEQLVPLFIKFGM